MNIKQVWWLACAPICVMCFSPKAYADGPIKQDPIEFVQAGAYTKVTVPGYGKVAMGVGRISVSAGGVVTYSGQADFVEGDLALLCSILA